MGNSPRMWIEPTGISRGTKCSKTKIVSGLKQWHKNVFYKTAILWLLSQTIIMLKERRFWFLVNTAVGTVTTTDAIMIIIVKFHTNNSYILFCYLEYQIPGTPSPDGACHFTYRSTSKLEGRFNSPRYWAGLYRDTWVSLKTYVLGWLAVSISLSYGAGFKPLTNPNTWLAYCHYLTQHLGWLEVSKSPRYWAGLYRDTRVSLVTYVLGWLAGEHLT